VHTDRNSDFLIGADALHSFTRRLIEAAGAPSDNADLVARTLVAANLRGVDSHGVHLLRPYIEALERGKADPQAEGRVVSECGATMVYDGENGLGQVVARNCCGHAVRLAKLHGLGLVTVRESNHFGAAAYWAQRIASEGLIGMAMCNATPLVAPWQGRERRLGTNPIAIAMPGPNTWLLDMATTTVALNRIWKAAMVGQSTIPPGWAMDKDGAPTTNTMDALEGFAMPLGGYKGTGLAIMVEILSAVLSGGAMATELGGLRVEGKLMRVGHCFLAIDVSRFMPLDEFISRMQRLRDIIKSTAPAEGYDEVLMAGDPEWRTEEERSQNGIPIPQELAAILVGFADKLSVVTPPEFHQ
jgi:LDH2 family malate/lactate/ureidoglycolate dehydrogenase